MGITAHKSVLKTRLAEYDRLNNIQKAIADDNEVNSLFEADKEDDAFQLIEKKYGGYPSMDESNNALVKLMQAIFAMTEYRNIDIQTICCNLTICMEAIEETRSLLN